MSQHLPLLRENLDRLGLFLKQERSVLLAILSYAVVVGVFSLIIPLTVQELVNTFAFAVSPVMVVTLVGIMAVILLFVSVFRVLQFYATDILERRVFVRVALALAQILPRFKEDSFHTDSISRFFETIFMQRALANLFVDFTNVFIGGFIGMVLLALYHPYFLIFDVILIGATFLIFALGKGGLRTTLHMSDAKYDAFHWFQEVADNLLHFKTTRCLDLVVEKADNLATAYVQARKSRFRVLLRQYIGSLSIQVILHTGLLGTAGWLLSKGELTLGQLVAAEVIVASLLLNLESVVKRLYLVYYFFTALTELDHLFSLPQDRATTDSADFSIPQSGAQGVHLACSGIRLTSAWWSIPKDVNFEALPGEKCALICGTESTRHGISLVIAGLQPPSTGVVRYNGIDVRNVSLDEVNELRGIVFGRDLRLFEGTMADNITMGRSGIESEDLLWALNVVQLNQEIDELPDGLQTNIKEGGRDFTPSQQLRILLARAIITRPSLLILDGALHEIPSHIRETIFRHLCSREVPWTLVVVTTDSTVRTLVHKCFTLS
ncbi:ABC transporter ATP-binding protein [Candidatus Nitronereus thalassa]|uniref:ABC transporter ATP-binding protein n=1 Tax=Candidatus Nitronereus thalassa TaxID=3020898 RepID=A0ABU3K835_9BACT|nr:ABC transporter ATP-binding protein [Candidatus Nitronereus thalassa]MDT7042545.1 ABC transporter ATP-binding protein [Candidatus Nitronereus thalassa]